jgi:hypothetical protein
MLQNRDLNLASPKLDIATDFSNLKLTSIKLDTLKKYIF